jgi:hypothetical protein
MVWGAVSARPCLLRLVAQRRGWLLSMLRRKGGGGCTKACKGINNKNNTQHKLQKKDVCTLWEVVCVATAQFVAM